MISKPKISERIFDAFNITFLIALSVIMVYPLWYVLCASLSSSNLIMAHEGLLFKPLSFTIEAYKMMFRNPMIVRGYFNSIFIVVSATLVNLLFTSICAYVLSRKGVYWNKLFSKLIIFTMLFGGGLIPTYLLVSQTLNMKNTYWALILPTTINVYNMVIMRTSFFQIPDSLEESAKLDGASHVRILFSIFLPLSKAILSIMALYYAVGHWNAWFDASIYITAREKLPLQMILREILINNDVTNMVADVNVGDKESVTDTIKYATVIFATVPILCLYPFLQKYFVNGIMIGAVKG